MLNIFRKKVFLDWEEYHDRMEKLEILCWQQSVRKKSMENLSIGN